MNIWIWNVRFNCNNLLTVADIEDCKVDHFLRNSRYAFCMLNQPPIMVDL